MRSFWVLPDQKQESLTAKYGSDHGYEWGKDYSSTSVQVYPTLSQIIASIGLGYQGADTAV